MSACAIHGSPVLARPCSRTAASLTQDPLRPPSESYLSGGTGAAGASVTPCFHARLRQACSFDACGATLVLSHQNRTWNMVASGELIWSLTHRVLRIRFFCWFKTLRLGVTCYWGQHRYTELLSHSHEENGPQRD